MASINKSGNILMFATHKGGVGKTASSLTCGQILTVSGYKVLIIDADPQRNCSRNLGSSTETGEDITRLYCEELSREEVEDYIYNSCFQGLELLPASIELSTVKYTLVKVAENKGDMTPYTYFGRNISTIRDNYDYIIIDCPTDILDVKGTSICYMICADTVYIPTNHDVTGTDGICGIMRLQKEAMQICGKAAKIGGVFLNASRHNNTHKGALEMYPKTLGDLYLGNIPQDSNQDKAYNKMTPILLIDKKSSSVKAYTQLLVRAGLLDDDHLQILSRYMHRRQKRRMEY